MTNPTITTTPSTEAPEWLSPAQIAKRYGLTLSWIYDRSALGRLPGQAKCGQLLRVHRPTFEEALFNGGIR